MKILDYLGLSESSGSPITYFYPGALPSLPTINPHADTHIRSHGNYIDGLLSHRGGPSKTIDAPTPESTPSKAKKTPAHENRLFPELDLYCEGAEKPVCRGFIHLFLATCIPVGMWHLYHEANGSIAGRIAGILYLLTNLICYGSSALYHVGRWSVNTEILLQKLDHCGIAILSVGTMIPVCILLLPFPLGLIFLTMSISTCAWTCWCLLVLRQPSACRQVLVASCVLPFLPFLYVHMNSIEWICTWLCMVSQVLGLLVYLYRCPNPFPRVFGSHEIFHVFVSIAGICVYIANWSIIRRTCNLYAHHTEVVELIQHFLQD